MLESIANYALVVPVYASPMETMGDRIKTLRQARGLTQERLGDLLGVTGAAVSAWERGDTANVKLKTFLTLCDQLHTNPQYLIFGPGKPALDQRKAGKP